VLEMETFIAVVVGSGLCVAVGHFIERGRGRPPRGGRTVLFNMACFVPASFLQGLLSPLIAGVTVLAVNAVGGGVITLPSRGWGLLAGTVVYLVAMDGMEYLFHRAQHKIPLLWSMHALHHSDAYFSVSTTIRHFWMDRLLKMLTIYLIAGCIFKVSPIILTIYGIFNYYNYVLHLDVGLAFGRWSWLLNAPRYHRLHHSRVPGDENCNFAALLPIFDVLTGAYRKPRPGEHPPTGLADEPGPASVMEALVWPLRGLLGRRLREA
jgi:sterol desaturase/sphingolipid hydroxylase (fatty acid hydroxylase superfamily)